MIMGGRPVAAASPIRSGRCPTTRPPTGGLPGGGGKRSDDTGTPVEHRRLRRRACRAAQRGPCRRLPRRRPACGRRGVRPRQCRLMRGSRGSQPTPHAEQLHEPSARSAPRATPEGSRHCRRDTRDDELVCGTDASAARTRRWPSPRPRAPARARRSAPAAAEAAARRQRPRFASGRHAQDSTSSRCSARTPLRVGGEIWSRDQLGCVRAGWPARSAQRRAVDHRGAGSAVTTGSCDRRSRRAQPPSRSR
jgi:hypothetical protein